MTIPAYAWDFSFLWSYRELILFGLWVTIAYTTGTILIGLAIGLLTGLMRLSRNKLPPVQKRAIPFARSAARPS